VSFSGNLVNPCLCREISMLIFSKVFFGGDELRCEIWDTIQCVLDWNFGMQSFDVFAVTRPVNYGRSAVIWVGRMQISRVSGDWLIWRVGYYCLLNPWSSDMCLLAVSTIRSNHVTWTRLLTCFTAIQKVSSIGSSLTALALYCFQL